MIIRSADFILSVASLSQCPGDGLPEVAFVGRSNVGKSSLINKLLGRRQLARTSGRPGKTQTLNYFLINEAFYLVDLPGYGYAEVSKSIKTAWAPLIDAYLGRREPLRTVVQLVDLRHPPSRDDRMMQAMLRTVGRSCIVAGTKLDKLSRNERARNEKVVREELPVGPGVPFVPTSAQDGTGMVDLWARLEEAVAGKE